MTLTDRQSTAHWRTEATVDTLLTGHWTGLSFPNKSFYKLP